MTCCLHSVQVQSPPLFLGVFFRHFPWWEGGVILKPPPSFFACFSKPIGLEMERVVVAAVAAIATAVFVHVTAFAAAIVIAATCCCYSFFLF